MSARQSLFVALLLGLIIPGIGNAEEKRPGQATAEPMRLAFVVGESSYQDSRSSDDSGRLTDVPSACDEAFAFRQSLLSLNFEPDNIFPNVPTSASATATDQEVKDTICNLNNLPLKNQLDAFVYRLQKSPRQYGIIYYAGHGAENRGEQYIFGTDTDIDFDDEIERMNDSEEYDIFHGNSVNLTQAIKQVNGLRGRALLVIIDSCRNNPVVEEYNDRLNRQWPTLSPDDKAKLSVGYISRGERRAKPDDEKPDYDTVFRSIIVLFSTARHATAADAPAGKTTHFSQEVRNYLTKDEEVQSDAARFVNDFKDDAKAEELKVPSNERQIPESIGSIARRPVPFCLKGCPQPIGSFSNEAAQTVPAESPPTPSGSTSSPVNSRQSPKRLSVQLGAVSPRRIFDEPFDVLGATSASDLLSIAGVARPGEASVDAHRYRTSYLKFAAAQEGDTPTPTVAVATDGSSGNSNSVPVALANRPVGMNIDVFYCTGDSQDGSRLSQARELALQLRASLPHSASISGHFLDVLRLRSLDLADNFGHALRKTGKSVWIDPADPVEIAWGKYLNAIDTNIQVKHTGIPTKNYVSIFFCSGVDLTKSPQVVYTQVPELSDVLQAAQYIEQIQSEHRDIWFEPRIQAVASLSPTPPKIPEKPQVRYLLDNQKPVAQRIAKELSAMLLEDVSILKIDSKQAGKDQKPPMEVWFGRDDSVRWNSNGTKPDDVPTPK